LTRPIGMQMIDLSPHPDDDSLFARIYRYLEPTLQHFREDMQARASDYYVASIPVSSTSEHPTPAGYVTRIDVVLRSDPFEPESAQTLRLIQTWLNKELPRNSFHPVEQAECYGITANSQDLAEVTEGDRHRVNALVLVAILLILLALVRRFWLAAYLL